MPFSNLHLGLEFENFSINKIIPCPDLITSPWRHTVWEDEEHEFLDGGEYRRHARLIYSRENWGWLGPSQEEWNKKFLALAANQIAVTQPVALSLHWQNPNVYLTNHEEKFL